MPDIFLFAADEAPAGLSLGGLISGLGGAGALGVLWYIVKLILDKTIPSRSDNRESTALVLDSLNNMVGVLQAEKREDADRLKAKQDRIDQLEKDADADFARVQDLRTEIMDLQSRLARKDRHIRILVLELRRLGATITGLDASDSQDDDLEVTMNPEEIQTLRDNITNPSEETY